MKEGAFVAVSWFRSMGLSFDGDSWMMVLSVYILRWGMVVICSAYVHFDVTCEVAFSWASMVAILFCHASGKTCFSFRNSPKPLYTCHRLLVIQQIYLNIPPPEPSAISDL